VLVLSLSAHANTIRQRNANAWDDECRRAHLSRVLRSLPDRVICTVGRPRRAIAVPPHDGRLHPDQHARTAKIPRSTIFFTN
jgi:hypothetical protein